MMSLSPSASQSIFILMQQCHPGESESGLDPSPGLEWWSWIVNQVWKCKMHDRVLIRSSSVG